MNDKGVKTCVAGFPRIGEKRELKKILELHWEGRTDYGEVETTARILKERHWKCQKDAGIDFISCNDFSLYDIMLDTAVMFSAIPERFQSIEDLAERYFAMARGTGSSVAMEMTKWLNTNYHYIVPELSERTEFFLNPEKPIGEYREARSCGIRPKINIMGPLTFLSLSRMTGGDKDALSLLPRLLPLYMELLRQLGSLDSGVFVQVDEPVLVRDSSDHMLRMLGETYSSLCSASDNVRLILMTYFDHAVEAVRELRDLPLYGIGLDFVTGPENLGSLSSLNGKKLFAGIVDGRNIWKTDYERTIGFLELIERLVPREDVVISTSCSLLHVPYSLEHEHKLAPELKSWMAFALEKLTELTDLAAIWNMPANERDTMEMRKNRQIMENRNSSGCRQLQAVRDKSYSIVRKERDGNASERREIQSSHLNLPFLPTTTIGSFPQTGDIRKLRSGLKTGAIGEAEYSKGIRDYIENCIRFQERIGLDVLVHGEPERNDMVEYFGEKLTGFAFTENGWVQSYGSRCVKPPVISGDVGRPVPMTVDTIVYAQGLTEKPVKGMLTGPVTILNWSFVRDDIHRSEVCVQIAMAISAEIADLQDAGTKIIQVDEAAFKEGYPLRKSKIRDYEKWAVECFRLAVSTARPETQIHTHMCYSDFNDIIETLKLMDADVITIETSRSANRLLEVFDKHGYVNDIGPGVYDIHSPRVPSIAELEEKIKLLLKAFPPSRLWINPDCGLKTRRWEEVEPSLKNMVRATERMRLML